MTNLTWRPYSPLMHAPILITGGSRGIGRAIRERLEDKGHRVINLDRQPAPDRSTDEIACDLNDPLSISNAIDQAPAQLSAVICVAGVGPIPSHPEQVVRINFLGTRSLIERLLPRIESGGAVTLIASSAGRDWKDNRTHVDSVLDTPSFESGLEWLEHHPTRWQNDPYKFSKQCLAAYTYRAAGLGKPRDIRVNCINPGITATALSDDFRALLGHETYDRIVQLSGRAAEPQDIAGLAEFLTVGDAHWINGVEITVDGGYHAGQIAGWHPY